MRHSSSLHLWNDVECTYHRTTSSISFHAGLVQNYFCSMGSCQYFELFIPEGFMTPQQVLYWFTYGLPVFTANGLCSWILSCEVHSQLVKRWESTYFLFHLWMQSMNFQWNTLCDWILSCHFHFSFFKPASLQNEAVPQCLCLIDFFSVQHSLPH